MHVHCVPAHQPPHVHCGAAVVSSPGPATAGLSRLCAGVRAVGAVGVGGGVEPAGQFAAEAEGVTGSKMGTQVLVGFQCPHHTASSACPGTPAPAPKEPSQSLLTQLLLMSTEKEHGRENPQQEGEHEEQHGRQRQDYYDDEDEDEEMDEMECSEDEEEQDFVWELYCPAPPSEPVAVPPARSVHCGCREQVGTPALYDW